MHSRAEARYRQEAGEVKGSQEVMRPLPQVGVIYTIQHIYGEVPETLVFGETSDISAFCELEWYEWVIFRDSTVSFLEDKVVIEKYLGLSIDIGPAMTAKLLKSNGQVVHRSMYRALTPDEIASPEKIKEWAEFLLKIE
jgi:hypothetical protein